MGIQVTCSRKQSNALVNDLDAMGLKSDLYTYEIGSFGYFEKEAVLSLVPFYQNGEAQSLSLLLELSKIAVVCFKNILCKKTNYVLGIQTLASFIHVNILLYYY